MEVVIRRAEENPVCVSVCVMVVSECACVCVCDGRDSVCEQGSAHTGWEWSAPTTTQGKFTTTKAENLVDFFPS